MPFLVHELIPGTITGGPQGTEAGIVSNLNEPFCLVCPARPLCILIEVAIGAMNWSYISTNSLRTILDNRILHHIAKLGNSDCSFSVSLFYRRFWCRICPLGALTALFSSFTPFKQIALTSCKRMRKNALNVECVNVFAPLKHMQFLTRKGAMLLNPGVFFVHVASSFVRMKMLWR